MAGPYVYPNPRSLVGQPYAKDIARRNEGECVSLIKKYITELQNKRTTTWIEGPNVIETIKKGGTVLEGTAIATFKNGRFESGHGHAAFFAGWSNDDPMEGIRIIVVEQYLGGTPSEKIISRCLHSRGKDANGNYINPSNNGNAFSVIL